MRQNGYTLVDLLMVLIVLGIVAVIAPLWPSSPQRARPLQLRDQIDVRGISQGMWLLAQNNQDRFPLPSKLDSADHTLAGDAASKDATANIISMLIYQSYFLPEHTVSSAESNPSIRVFDKYQYTEPSAALNPNLALWDPTFAADFTVGDAHLSYAMLPLWTEERVTMVNSLDSMHAVVGNRGPQIASATYGRAGEAWPGRTSAKSNTDLIHGGRTTWEGNIAYGDNHVNFETTMTPEAMKWKDRAGSAFGDVLFYDEPGDTSDTNAFLSIFVNTGATKDQWRAIWD